MKIEFSVKQFFIVLSIVVALGLNQAAHSAPVSKEQLSYQSDAKRLDKFRDNHDLIAMEKICEELLPTWHKKNVKAFIDLTCQACEILSSFNFNNPKQFILAERYAFSALDDPTPKLLDDQACLVMYGLSHYCNTSKNTAPEDVQTKRAKIAKWWFVTWQRIDSLIDPKFNPKDYPYELNVMPSGPKDQFVFSGMSPSNIKDVKARKEYENAIAQNRKNLAIVNERKEARDLMRTFSSVATQCIGDLYAAPPENRNELSDFVRIYIKDGSSQNRIFDAVKSKSVDGK